MFCALFRITFFYNNLNYDLYILTNASQKYLKFEKVHLYDLSPIYIDRL